jgi:ABC-type phosphate/phosphonate transport system substrate-binding protein
MSSVTPTKKSFREEIMAEITVKLMEKLQDTVKQKIQDALKKYQDTTNKKQKTQKQLNKLREDFGKLQSETKET